MNKNNNSTGKKQPSKETEDSLNKGKKAMEVQEKIAATKNDKPGKASKDDAQKWRNEG